MLACYFLLGNRNALPTLVILSFLVSCGRAFSCTNGLHAFPPDSCASLSPGNRGQCDSGTNGLAVLTESQLSPGGILSSYAAAVLEDNQLMWLGYSYNSAGNLLQDGQGLTGMAATSAILNNDTNFDSSNSESAGSGVCVAVNRNGSFVRKLCNDTLQWSLCQRQYVAPNATASGPVSVSEGSSVSLTCSTSGTDVTVSWLALLDSAPPTTLPSTSTTYTIDSYSQNSHAGYYFCVAMNPLGAYVSTPVFLSTAASDNFNVSAASITPSASPEVYGRGVNYTCSSTLNTAGAVTGVYWFVNGVVAATSTGNQLVVPSVQHAGYYQCFVTTSGGEVYQAERLVMPRPGVPGMVDEVSVEPISRSSLSVQWLCPEAVGTYAPILLNYQVIYSTSSSSSNQSVVHVRTSESMQDKDSCLLKTELEGLEEGTSYSVKVRAMTGAVAGEVPVITAQEATFGLAPGPVINLVVFRTTDKKTVQAKWDKVETTPPVGVVSEYHIEYRQYGKKSVSSIKNTADQTMVTIANVVNSDSYELRVRAGVLSTRDPLTVSYGPFTEWKRVGDGGPVTPAPLSTDPRNVASIIAASVVVGGLTFIIILSLFVVGVACIILKARRGQLGSFYKSDHFQLKELEEDG